MDKLLYSAIISLKPVSKKNSQRIVKIANHYAIMPSKAYKEYEHECKRFLFETIKKPIRRPVTVKTVFFYPLNKDGTVPKNAPDLSNLMEACHDVMVKYGILEDDNSNIIKSVDGSRVIFTRETEPCTEIYVLEYEDD